jgi:hypothetical protein
MPPNTSPADRAIYDASAGLDKLLSQARAFRSGLTAIRLPIDAANDRLDHSDDLIAILISQLHSASAIVDTELERIQAAEQAAALVAEDRAVDRDFARWETTLRTPHPIPTIGANDDQLARLVAGLRGGVL